MAAFKKRKNYRKFSPIQLFKECQFCKEGIEPNYKEVGRLVGYLQRTSKITSTKINSNCAKHQRKLARAIKRARFLALIPFTRRVKS